MSLHIRFLTCLPIQRLGTGLFLLVFLMSASLAQASLADGDLVYVAPSADCGGAAPCFATIQAGIDAVTEGGVVKVAAGAYTAPGFEIAYINKALTITGGYSTTDWTLPDPQANPTIVDAQDYNGRRGMTINGAAVSGPIIIEGLTFRNGRLTGAPGVVLDGGAGMRIDGGQVTLRDTRFESNDVFEGSGEYDSMSGGGMLVTAGTITIEHSVFTGSEAPTGGGVALRGGMVNISHCDFNNNITRRSGGQAVHMNAGVLTMDSSTIRIGPNNSYGIIRIVNGSATLTHNLIEGNTTGYYNSPGIFFSGFGLLVFTDNTVRGMRSNLSGGGGIWLNGGTGARIERNLFENNQAKRGGAMIVSGSAHIIADNVFQGNHSSDTGGAIQFEFATGITFNNNRLEGSTAETKGGALFLQSSTISGQNNLLAGNVSAFESIAITESSSLQASHWTLAGNGKYGILADTTSSAALTNTLITGHEVAGLYGAGISADHTLFYGNGGNCAGGAVCANTLSGDPRYIDPTSGDYHLGSGSAAIDAGIDAGVTTDLDGEARPVGSGFDIGADEFPLPPVADFTHSSGSWVGQAISFTSTATGAYSYAWDFGDGASSSQPNPTHAYTAAGSYPVILTVTNPAGADSTTQTVEILYQASFTTSGPDWLGQETSFTNTTLTAGDTTYAWNFGDGQTSAVETPTHTYAAAGIYTVTLTAANSAGSGSHTAQVTVFGVPQPTFTTTSPDWLGQTTTFTAALAPNPLPDDSTILTWDFGDGAVTPGGLTAAHAYAAPGDYPVTLTAANAAGSDTYQQTVHIQAPSISFSASSYAVNEGNPTVDITAQLSAASEAPVSVQYSAAPGTALAADFTPTSGTLNFAPGQTSAAFSVSIAEDNLPEPGETVALSLSSPINGLPGAQAAAALLIADNESPQVTALNPASVPAGSPAFTLTVTGYNFLDGVSVVRWNGEELPTTYISGNELRASVAVGKISTAGQAEVTVMNPYPSGGVSNARILQVQAAPVAVCPGDLEVTLQSPAGAVKVFYQGVTTCATLSVSVDSALSVPPPSGYTLLPNFFELTDSGSGFTQVTVQLPYAPLPPGTFESALRLLHYQNGAWVDVTSGQNTAEGWISGTVSQFSPFAIGVYNLAPCAISINNGAMFTGSLDVRVYSSTPADQIMLSSDAGFGGAYWQPYSPMIAWQMPSPGQRIVTLIVYARLRQGGAPLCGGLSLSDDIIYDPLAPTTSFTFAPTGAPAPRQGPAQQRPLVQSGTLQLQIQAADQAGGSGVAEMQISTNPAFSGARWQPFAATAQVSAVTGQTVYVRTRDGAGNISNTAQRVVPDKVYHTIFLPQLLH